MGPMQDPGSMGLMQDPGSMGHICVDGCRQQSPPQMQNGLAPLGCVGCRQQSPPPRCRMVCWLGVARGGYGGLAWPAVAATASLG